MNKLLLLLIFVMSAPAFGMEGQDSPKKKSGNFVFHGKSFKRKIDFESEQKSEGLSFPEADPEYSEREGDEENDPSLANVDQNFVNNIMLPIKKSIKKKRKASN